MGVNAMTDPNTGLVYLAGGYTSSDHNSMNVYNFVTDTISGSALPPTVLLNRLFYANVWSQKRKSILCFGGYNSSKGVIPDLNTVTEFVPSTSVWSTLVPVAVFFILCQATSGIAPAMRADHCMASNDDGSLMVIYGGRLSDLTTFSGEVFIFDTVSQTWRQGLTGTPRVYAACTIAGNQLLVWGGQNSTDLVAPAPILIYDLNNNAWITQYTPPASYVAARASETSSSSPNATSTGLPSSNRSSSSNAGAIVGGAVAGTTPPPAVSTHDDELQQMRTQIQNQQEQMELQQSLLLLQQQQQQLQLPIRPQHQYQDATYNYQPPIFYSAAGGQTANPLIATTTGSPPQEWDTAHTSPDSMNLVPTSGWLVRAGYVDGGSSYANAQQQHLGIMPVVYNPPTTTAGPSEVTTEEKGEYESNYWERRPLGSPHAIIET
ncbi:hypothetical protein BGZ54_009791 [Gamsiella multidivaricata]|nr:hypothetical protein BGZ54_009791 [Gamsiella multidivaricata]